MATSSDVSSWAVKRRTSKLFNCFLRFFVEFRSEYVCVCVCVDWGARYGHTLELRQPRVFHTEWMVRGWKDFHWDMGWKQNQTEQRLMHFS